MIKAIDIRINPQLAKSDHDPAYLLSLILDIGEEMLTSGAEINRVEDSIYRMLSSYGFRKVNVFSIPEFISVSFLDKSGTMISESRRIYKFSNDFNKLEALNELSRYICYTKPTVYELWDKLEHIEPVSYAKNPFILAIAYFLGGGGFTIFFGGSIIDGLAAGVTALLIMLCNRFSRVQNMNKIVFTMLAAICAGSFATICHTLGFGLNLDKIMIGDIMLLIPGMALTTSLRDMLCGDIIAGILRFIESLFIAGAIALGYAISLLALGGHLW